MNITKTHLIIILGGMLSLAIVIVCIASSVIFWLLYANNTPSIVSQQNARISQLDTPTRTVAVPTETPVHLPTLAVNNDPCSPNKLRDFASTAESYRLEIQDSFERYIDNVEKRPELYEPIHEEIVASYLEFQRLEVPACAETKNLHTELLEELEFIVDVTSSPFAVSLFSIEDFEAQVRETNQAFENLTKRAGN
jgi:hypothetical protein